LGATKVVFFGHLVNSWGVKPDATNVETIQNFPTPTIVTNVCAFLGLTNYYEHFIHCYAKLPLLLSKLLKKDVKFY
jgi:hypothetical protein